MTSALLVKDIRTRAVLVPLRRPVIAGIGRFDLWPLVLIDLETTGGIIGHSYVAPYRSAAIPVVVAALRDLRDMLKGMPAAPFDAFESAAKALNVVGSAGMSMIVTSAVDMAIWDTRAKAANEPLVMFLGGTLGPVRSDDSNGLWRHEVSTLAAEAR